MENYQILRHKILILNISPNFNLQYYRKFVELFRNLIGICKLIQGGLGHWAVYYTSPQSLIITFSYLLA